MEQVQGLPEGELQMAYSEGLVRAMRDSLDDNPLAEAVIQFASQHQQQPWSGSPQDLLQALGQVAGSDVITTREWPENPMQLSLRLKKLTSALSGAGVRIVIGKARKRFIQVEYTGRSS